MDKTDIIYESADGLHLYAASYGPSDAALSVLCMHGLTRNHKDFEPLINALQPQGCDRMRFVAVDVRGRGRSQAAKSEADYAVPVYAKDMLTLLDTLGLQKVALIGTSMGGLMSMALSKAAPSRLLGVVMNDVGPKLEQAGLDRIAGYANSVEPEADWPTAAGKVEAVQSDIFPSYGPDQWMAFARRTYREMDDGRVILDYDPAITRTVGDVKPGLMTRIAMWRLYRSMFPRPLLLVRGQQSDILSEKTAMKMIKRHRDATLVTVPGVGHAPILDEPEAVSAIASFLKRLEVQS